MRIIKQGNLGKSSNFADADQMIDLFESKSVPIRGHVVFWSVDGHSPDWFEAMTDNTQKQGFYLSVEVELFYKFISFITLLVDFPL